MGGIARRARVVRDIEKEHPGRTLVLDAGDLFFRSPLTSPRDEPQAKETALFLADSLFMLRVPAMAVGERDLAFGLSTLRMLAKRSGTVMLASNVVHARTGTAAFDPFVLAERGGRKIGIVGATLELDPKSQAYDVYRASGLTVKPAEASLAEAARMARNAGADLVVGLLHLSHARAREVLSTLEPGLVDLSVVAHDRAASNMLEVVGQGPSAFMMSGDRGKWMLAIEVEVTIGARGVRDIGAIRDAKSAITEIEARVSAYEREDAGVTDPALRERLAADRKATVARLLRRKEQMAQDLQKTGVEPRHGVSARLIPLDVALPEDQEMLAALNAFKDRLHVVNAGIASIDRSSMKYVGADACKACHAGAYAHWKKTKHAEAWATMERTRQTANLDCIPCHVTGFDRPGGPSGTAGLGPFVAVGCESCHGPGSAHAANPEVTLDRPRNVPEKICAECHRAQADQKPFDFEERLPRVLGEGHGHAPPAPRRRAR